MKIATQPTLHAMKYVLALTLGVVPLSQAFACDRDLVGTWTSDRDMSMTFIRNHAKLRAKTDAFLDALLGKMTFTFTDGDVRLHMPDTRVPISGEWHAFAGIDEKKPYKTLFCSSTMIVWSAKRSFGEGEEATTFNFEGPDLVWIYTGSTAPGVPDLHAREYFRRVR